MRKILFILPVLIVLSSFKPAESEAGGIKWLTMQEALKQHQKKPKKLLVDVYTEWCGWCKRMDAATYKDPKVVKYINETFYAVKFDAESKEPITYKGKEYKFLNQGNRGVHELAVELLGGQMGYPSTVFLDNKTALIQNIPGYHAADEFNMIMHYFGADNYKTTSWEQFQSSFKQ